MKHHDSTRHLPEVADRISGGPAQMTLDDLGRPLSAATFVVVDLETTGGSPARGSRITEVGAVKVCGGEVIGEFQSLVNPDESIPAFITVLTGITNQMVVDAPRIAEVLPSFLEFARGCVLVAHNAPFDIGFLKHAARELAMPWPNHEVLDTAVIARQALTRDEVPNVKLSTLAARFGSATTPDHRALSDARATVDVLHALFERLGSLGVTTVEEVSTYTSKVTPAQRRKRHLADHVPDAPGVYLFRGPRDDVLYVGTSRRLRSRVRTYFTRAETRTRMGEMVSLASRVEAIVCATALEAQVRELRLIAHHRPPYNRRSKFPERVTWIKLTREPWPRLSIVRAVLDDDADYIGPFRRREGAEDALTALHDTFRIRQCTARMGRRPRGTPCVLAQMGRCLSPCDGSADADEYATEVDRVRRALTADPVELVDTVRARMADLAGQERYEDAAHWRDRLTSFLRAASRTQRLRELTAVPELVAAAPHPEGWEIHVLRLGRLAAAGVMPHGTHPIGWVDALLATAETVSPGFGPAPAATHEETELVLRWLATPGLRLVRGAWQAPLSGSARHLEPLIEAESSRRDLLATRLG
ncbi:DEDD exonuclease domain-containing protein [Aeromicrobium sp. CF3.5]|uniref:DEDD exonuclease domain-containing protein n=1 Tax=Aeromicrobium sp. CF3.5 TaxID=3373078 RepID=UPI003EE55528